MRKNVEKLHRLRGAPVRIESDCAFVIGPSGSGKTTLLRAHEDDRLLKDPERATKRKVISARAPDTPTPKMLALEILEKLGVPKPTGNIQALREQIITQLSRQSIDLLVLEDMQRVVSYGKGYLAANLIGDLLDDGTVPIVIAGLTEVEILKKVNSQIKRRSRRTIELKAHSWTDPDQQSEFIDILGAMEAMLEFKPSGFSFDVDLCKRMSYAHGGLLGNVVKHLKRVQDDIGGALSSGERNQNTMSLSDLAISFAELRSENETFDGFDDAVNPFDLTVPVPGTWAIADRLTGSSPQVRAAHGFPIR